MALTDNLISYYKLDESSGNAADSVGSNTGTNTNVTYAAGKINNGAVFNGTNAKLITGVTGFPTIQGNKTVSLWFNSSSITTTQQDSIFGLFDNASSPSNSYQIVMDNATGGSKIKVTKWGGAVVADSGFTPTVSTWYHLVVTYDGTNTIIYINGDLKVTSNTAVQSGTSASCVMGIYPGGTVEWYNGIIDEVGIWSRALSSTEVTALYNSGNGLQYPFTTTSIKSFNGLAKASIKSINGLAIASVKSVNGLA